LDPSGKEEEEEEEVRFSQRALKKKKDTENVKWNSMKWPSRTKLCCSGAAKPNPPTPPSHKVNINATQFIGTKSLI